MSSNKIIEQIVEILANKIISEMKTELDFKGKWSDNFNNIK